MLGDLLAQATDEAAETTRQVEHEFAFHGVSRSSGTPLEMERRIRPIHARAVNDSMTLIVQFSERTRTPISELCDAAKPRLVAFTSAITDRTIHVAEQVNLTQQAAQARERLAQHVRNALRDVQIGFIKGRAATVAESSTNQSKALLLLKAIYDKTRNRTDPVFVAEIAGSLSEEEAKAAWRYLKNRGLIDTFNIAYTARISGAGVDAIENAQKHPDTPVSAFPSVTYNIVYNTVHVDTMSHSQVQQAGAQSTQSQTLSYSPEALGELNRLVKEFALHLDDLQLEARQKQKAAAQIATLKAQLMDEPDPIILRQAGHSLRNITEGAIGSLLAAAAAQPGVWIWVSQVMQRLFA